MQRNTSPQIGPGFVPPAWPGPQPTGSPRSVQPLTRREATGSAAGIITDVDGAFLVDVLTAAMAAGFGITFSATSDGGALSVTLLGSTGRFRDYCTNLEHLNSTLDAIRGRATDWLARNTPPTTKAR